MTNKTLQDILSNYPDECEILIIDKGDCMHPVQICAEYSEDDDFVKPQIIFYT